MIIKIASGVVCYNHHFDTSDAYCFDTLLYIQHLQVTGTYLSHTLSVLDMMFSNLWHPFTAHTSVCFLVLEYNRQVTYHVQPTAVRYHLIKLAKQWLHISYVTFVEITQLHRSQMRPWVRLNYLIHLTNVCQYKWKKSISKCISIANP